MDKKFIVYKHTNKVNGKVYIGITSQKAERRWGKNGEKYIKDNQYFGNAIKKYGWDGFTHEILIDNLTKEKAEQYEIDLIELYESTNRDKGYNISIGGGLNIGFKFSEKSKNLMSETRKERGLAKGGNNSSAKKVICEDITFDCIKDCAQYYKINHSTMKSWLNGGRNMPLRFIEKNLKYVDEPNNQTIQNGKVRGSNNHMSKKVVCCGIIFDCIRDCAEFFKVNYSTMKCWINGSNKMPQKFKDFKLGYYEGIV